ncbi:hypothetical protein B9Q02_11125 [Candidatus Marsarchaeota G1 archaeon BE_D]|uniref:PIG-L family deacetylase n=2 Tax=Candidatus Marsarchaeota TaxID=1978152 RepID=A0A2R6C0Z9_9ARCH|nr:MAG: hypothetical protein B9Q02_11125 [Candidatus Marsarchaeota G1 archaeon BE_D]PSO04523.1 MAG: hypothetical protein B9Q12_02290 [Candidatus Marsarchaeota G2 archaeon ECH_B_SAG-G06]
MYTLLLSPHPDDVVYSAFFYLKHDQKRVCVTLFNVSSFNKWRLQSKFLTTTLRTLEDKLVLSLLRCKSVHLYLEDSSVRVCRKPNPSLWVKESPSIIVAPAAIGSHIDHLVTRELAIKLFEEIKNCELVLYQDLPYAAKISDLKKEEDALSGVIGNIKERVLPLTKEEIKKKVKMAKLYFSQTDYTALIVEHAKRVGKEAGFEYAEKYYLTSFTR